MRRLDEGDVDVDATEIVEEDGRRDLSASLALARTFRSLVR